jgi:large subunit ribosomal protein L1
MKRSKKYKQVLKQLDKSQNYSLKEAVTLIPQLSTSKFAGSIEIHVNLLLTEKQQKENIRGSVTLPYQVGTPAKIVVLTTPEHFEEAKGADTVGGEDLIKKIEKGWNEFDIVIATPEVMQKVAILGRILGPKGKMPNPKNDTVTTHLKQTIENYKKGKIDFKADGQGGIHKVIAKTTMKPEEILENIFNFLKAIVQETKRYTAVPFKSIFISPTMGPSIKLDTASLLKDLTTE